MTTRRHEQSSALLRREMQSVGQQAHGLAVGPPADLAFEGADALSGQVGPLGQLLLGQARGKAIAPQQLTKARGLPRLDRLASRSAGLPATTGTKARACRWS